MIERSIYSLFMMDPNILIASITTGGATLTALTALVLNHRGFKMLDHRFDDINRRFNDVSGRFDAVDRRFASIEHRLEVIEGDLKQFYRTPSEHATGIARLKDKTGLA